MWCHRPGGSRGRRSGWTGRQRRPRRTGGEGQSHVEGDVTGDDDKDNDGSFYHACLAVDGVSYEDVCNAG